MGKPIRFLSTKEVLVIAGGITKMTLWRWIKQGRFPQSVNLSGQLAGRYTIGWVESEIEDWAKNRIDQRNKLKAA